MCWLRGIAASVPRSAGVLQHVHVPALAQLGEAGRADDVGDLNGASVSPSTGPVTAPGEPVDAKRVTVMRTGPGRGRPGPVRGSTPCQATMIVIAGPGDSGLPAVSVARALTR